MARRKEDMSESAGTVGVFMRLRPEVVAALDELAESTSVSRGAMVSELVQQAAGTGEVREVREVVRTYRTVVLADTPRGGESREAAVDE